MFETKEQLLARRAESWERFLRASPATKRPLGRVFIRSEQDGIVPYEPPSELVECSQTELDRLTPNGSPIPGGNPDKQIPSQLVGYLKLDGYAEAFRPSKVRVRYTGRFFLSTSSEGAMSWKAYVFYVDPVGGVSIVIE